MSTKALRRRRRTAKKAKWRDGRSILVADLFCGAGGSSTGCRHALRRRGIKMKLVAVNHWPIAVETHKRNHPDARHYCVNLDAADPLTIVPEGRLDLLMASPECFPGDTMVLTARGVIPISLVRRGDFVLTHRSRWRKVTATNKKYAETIQVRGEGHFGIETTSEHPIFVRAHRQVWQNAVRAYKTKYDEPGWVNAGKLGRGFSWATPHRFDPLALPPVPGRGFEFSESFFYLVGLWLAEGVVRPSRGEITLCMGKHEGDEVAAFLSKFDPATEKYRAETSELRWRRRDIRTATLFETAHKGLASWLVEHFGRHAHRKTIPGWLLGGPAPWRRAVLEGYLYGDGCRSGRVIYAGTASRALAVGIKLLAASLGYRPCMRKEPAHIDQIEGRTVHASAHFIVYWRVPAADSRPWGLSDETHLWQKIKRDVEPRGRQPVYNIQVEEDESYTADGIVVHNCRFFSSARGGKAIDDQNRMSAWHVVRWCTELRVRVVMLENVPEFQRWGPLNGVDRPIKDREGEYFNAFVASLEAIGFKVEWRVLNAADYGEATTRRRLFLIARSDGKAIYWPKKTHSKDGNGARRWRPASKVIDWTLEGDSIFTRKKALSAKTIERIWIGALKYGWDEPWLVLLRNHADARGIDLPLPTICANGNHMGLAVKRRRSSAAKPFLLPQRSDDLSVRDVETPLPAITTVARPALIQARGPQTIVVGNRSNDSAKDPEKDPVPAITTSAGGGVWIAKATKKARRRAVVAGNRTNNAAKDPENDPIPAITTATGGGVYVVEAVRRDRPRALHMRSDCQGGNGVNVRGEGEPLYTSTGAPGGGLAVVVPQGGGGRARGVKKPLPTVHADGAIALVSPYYGNGKARAVSAPLPTATTKDRLGLVLPVTHSDVSCRARSTDEPLPTVTSAPRGELAFLTPGFGERPTQTPRTHPVSQPLPTVCARGQINLAEPVGPEPEYDIKFRMLQPHELAGGMGFNSHEARYEFAGNKTERTKQIGNAVSVRQAAALVGAIFRSEARERRRRKGM